MSSSEFTLTNTGGTFRVAFTYEDQGDGTPFQVRAAMSGHDRDGQAFERDDAAFFDPDEAIELATFLSGAIQAEANKAVMRRARHG